MDRNEAGKGTITSPRRGEVGAKRRVRGTDRFRERAQQLRASETSAEARLWRALRNRQLDRWKFRRQHPIDRYVVDFVTLGGKLIVEVDGATHSTPREIARDVERTRVLEALGFHIIRVTNCDVYDNLDSVVETIWSELNPSPP
ncbi:MAG: endonuclease domain-containing protein [Bauldia sp.]|nr:endonuclease domain-containing protein [Bauldia sp.]